MTSLSQLFTMAIEEFSPETGTLEFLANNRYDSTMFPETGQYDWFSAQLLYCLIRYLKPRRILEISTASGYSTMFMALALKRNSAGIVETYELNPVLAKSAQRLFARYNVSDFVNLHVGDARETSLNASTATIYFLDSLHTEDFARWFIETHVMRSQNEAALFHMHDILPYHARVRFRNGPPFKNPGRILRGYHQLRSWGGRILKGSPPISDERIPLRVYPLVRTGGLPTVDGNFTTESLLGNELASVMLPEDSVFLYDVADTYPQLHPRTYDRQAIARADANNNSKEWNNSWWCKVSALKRVMDNAEANSGNYRNL